MGSLYVFRRTVDLSGHVGRPHEHNERHGKQARAHTLPMTVSYIGAIHKGKLSFQDKYKYKSYLHNQLLVEIPAAHSEAAGDFRDPSASSAEG